MLLPVLKSVSAYLQETTTFDVYASMLAGPNMCRQYPTTPGASSIAEGELTYIIDERTDLRLSTETGEGQYIQITWGTNRYVDGIRYYWQGPGAPIAKVCMNDPSWGDMPGVASFQVVTGWNVVRFPKGLTSINGVRLERVSGGSGVMRCCEFEAYADMRQEPKPTDFGTGGFKVLHPGLNLSESSVDVPLVTIGDSSLTLEPGEVGNDTRLDRLSVIVGLHCSSEDQLEEHTEWAKRILDGAVALDADGNTYPGIPLRGIRHRMRSLGSNWWTSGQRGWYASPAPVIRVNGTITAATTTDRQRGCVELTGVASTADVRADFTCGIWDFQVKGVVRAGIDSPAQILHRHNSYLLLESDVQFHELEQALA